MVSPAFRSYSQNAEDVVLWRALQGIERGRGRYIEVGANDPHHESVSFAFYERGWSGITVEPDPTFAAMHRAERPLDRLVEAALQGTDGGSITFYVVEQTGLSTTDPAAAAGYAEEGRTVREIKADVRSLQSVLDEQGWQGTDIHFLSVDTEGSEAEVLRGIDLDIYRPWIILVEATKPLSTVSTRAEWESLVVDRGYQFCLFDGLSCFYVAEEHAAGLASKLSYPACPHDQFTESHHAETLETLERTSGEITRLRQDVTSWRTLSAGAWSEAQARQAHVEQLEQALADVNRDNAYVHEKADEMWSALGQLNGQVEDLRSELDAMERSRSWRITGPLRKFADAARKTGLGRLARRVGLRQ